VKIKKSIAQFIFKVIGWQIIGEKPSYKKFLLIIEPHTSNWDAVIGILAAYIFELKLKFIIKAEVMFFPLNLILKPLGAIPIDRNRNKSLTKSNIDVICEKIESLEEAAIAISVKGTRGKVNRLKTGFYYIAKKESIPICLGFADYKKKIAGIGDTYFVGEDFDSEVKRLNDFYKDKIGKHPENNFFK
jgi:1-acyl-sn-glycerol-3-phosphate acyltransferase